MMLAAFLVGVWGLVGAWAWLERGVLIPRK